MDAIEALKTRRSVRRFEDTPIPREILEDIVDCARFAPTSRNEQPWEFVVLTDRKAIAGIANMTDNGRFMDEAPAAIVVLCRKSKYYIEDGSSATVNILTAAHAHGVGSCWIAGDKKPYAGEVRRFAGAPDDFLLLSIVALGYSKQRPRPSKRSLRDVIHWEKFRQGP